MLLQATSKSFSGGAEESECFTKMEFHSMKRVNISKVQFFSICHQSSHQRKTSRPKAVTLHRIDKLLESQMARVLAFAASMPFAF